MLCADLVNIVFTELPKSAPGIVCNNRTRDSHWGKPEVIAAILRIGEQWAATKTTPISVGQISRRNGEVFPPHKSHRKGYQVDVRLMRKDGKNLPITIHDKQYDPDATRAMIQMIRSHAKVKSILCNDQGLIAAGLTSWFANHENHAHINFDY